MDAGDSHWVRWHGPYDDPASGLSRRLRIVQSMVRRALDDLSSTSRAQPLRVLSLCAGQGRDVIDVLATHPVAPRASALLVELDPALVAFARERAAAAGLAGVVRVVEGDAARCAWYADDVPADLVLLCGIFGNVRAEDITATIRAMRGFCAPGGHVVWTRHRRPPDATPAIRAEFAAAGFTEVSFVAPAETVMTVGHHRFDGVGTPFDPDQVLFEFVGDGFAPV
ncbi:MAG TPA: methyltransferase domain-containing protein [Acidimicrobiales bacterium]|nr:methyltransferase domain-containing protein [Acidimicrobiales bacterium]